MESINFIKHKPFFAFITGLLDSNHFASRQDNEPLRLLDIGCGPGDFATLLKRHYQDKIIVTAIDPSEKAIKKAQSIDVDVDFNQASVLDWKPNDVKYDAIIFTKSLHHCHDLEKTVQHVKGLLADGGFLVVEEIQREHLDKASIFWMFDRYDLLTTAKLVRIENVSDHHAKFLDTTVPADERWRSVSHSNEHHSTQSIQDTVTNVFGKERTRIITKFPFMHVLLAEFAGLEDTAIGRSILTEFMVQEDRALANGFVRPLGYNIVAEK